LSLRFTAGGGKEVVRYIEETQRGKKERSTPIKEMKKRGEGISRIPLGNLPW